MNAGTAAGERPEIWAAIETSTPTGSVAIWKGRLAFEQILRIQRTHSERLLPALDRGLAMTDTSPEEVEAVVIGSGPGSFTGVRIAASLGKGWAMARGVPLYAYSSLWAVAAGSGACGSVCAMFDARRSQVYAGCYDVSSGASTVQLEPGVWGIGTLIEELARRGLEPVFAGNGAIAYRREIESLCNGAVVLPEHLGIPRAASLLWLRAVAPDLGLIAEPEVWEPSYVRDWRVQEGRESR